MKKTLKLVSVDVCYIEMLTSRTIFGIQANSVDSDQTAPRDEVWSGSTLLAIEIFKRTNRLHSFVINS